MSKGKVIENPEVPGLEEILPPPPPPPIISEHLTKTAEILKPPPPPPPPAPIITPECNTFFMPAPVPPIPPSPHSLPWWVPTDDDTQRESYTQLQYETTIVATAPDTVIKTKHLKRKIEIIDPAEDAERVASAQRELTALMKPLNCDLCNAVMNSNLQAKLHYDGKPHQKKVSMYLNQSVKKFKIDDGQVTSTTTSDWNTYCEFCKTWFTSQTDAAQHYAGKKHTRATSGAAKLKAAKNTLNAAPIDPTGRFGIGGSFQPDNSNIPSPLDIPAPPPVAPMPAVAPISAGFVPGTTNFAYALRCDLCGVSANRLDQLEIHRRGARHQKMIRLKGMISTEPIILPIEGVVSASTIDYSIYRTPSGSYYCAPCNKSFNSENSFAQHVESKKHKNQVNPKPTTNQQSTKKDKAKKPKLS